MTEGDGRDAPDEEFERDEAHPAQADGERDADPRADLGPPNPSPPAVAVERRATHMRRRGGQGGGARGEGALVDARLVREHLERLGDDAHDEAREREGGKAEAARDERGLVHEGLGR